MAMERERVSAWGRAGPQPERASSLFPWSYSQELGFGTDQMIAQKDQSAPQVFMHFGWLRTP